MPVFRIRDNERLVVRALRPSDTPAFLDAFRSLSDRSRYLRFHKLNPRLREQDVAYLTRIDQENHVALAAFARTGGAALGRFVRLAEGSDVADMALTVLDAWQRRGIGTLLLAALMHRAREVGVTGFTASVLDENRAAMTMMNAIASDSRREGSTRVFTFSTDVSALPVSDLTDKVQQLDAGFTQRGIRFADPGA